MSAMRYSCHCSYSTHVNDVKGLVNRSLGVKGESGVNFGGNLARNDLQDLLSELDKETVEGSINLLIDVLAVLLSVGDGSVNELGILLLLGGLENQTWVGGGILRSVLGWLEGSIQLSPREKHVIIYRSRQSHQSH